MVRWLCVLIASLVICENGNAQAPTYKLVNLRTLGPQVVTWTSWFGGEYTYTNNSSRSYSINDSGVVVGASSSSLGDRGFVYRNKSMSSVGVLSSAHTWSACYDINNQGTIVGQSSDRGFILSNNVFTELELGAGAPNSINESSQVTGGFSYGAGNAAFLFEGGIYQAFLPPGTDRSQGVRLNESGMVVGYYDFQNIGGNHRPFKRNGSSAVDLGSLAGPSGLGAAYGVNDAGNIVGWTQDPNAGLKMKAFLIGTNGVMQSLGLIKDYTYSHAFDINNQDQVVGSLGNSNATGEAGFLWQSGTMYDLNDLVTNRDGWNIKRGNKINNLGWIVADGSKDGVGDRALLLIPDTANTSDYDGDGVSDAREFFDKTDINNSGSYTPSSIGVSVPAVGDTEAPTLNLLGLNPLIIPRGSAFTDPGASVVDDTDEYRIVTGTGTVDTTTVGIYTVTYTAQDLAGNLAAPVERSVFVYQPNNTLSIPTIPTSFPLTITTRPTNVLALRAWYGWNGNSFNQGKIPQALSNVVEISSGVSHNLALLQNGTIYGWGGNGTGQLNIPSDLSNVVSVSAAAYHSAALKADGTVVSWGSGQDNTMTGPPIGLSNVVAISYGPAASHILALKNDGSVVAWGWNDYGQCNVPSSATNVVAVSAGTYRPTALQSDGTVVVWGHNNFNQQNIPAGLSNVVAVSCSERGTLALKSNGTVVSWGDETVVIPSNVGTVARVKAGRFYNAVIQLDGTLVSFGSGAPTQPNDLPPVQELGIGSGWMIAGYEARDTNAPSITLIGANPLTVYLGSSFSDPGATVNDNLDAPRTIYATGSVNTASLGSYTLTYSASDSAFNSATPVTRTVNVSLDPNADQDGDGLTNSQEASLGSNPFTIDSNSDGVNDGAANSAGLNPTFNLTPLLNLLKSNPVAGLYNQSQYEANRTNGQSDILNNPNDSGLYTTNQIHNLGLGGIVLSRDSNNVLTLNYEVMQSTDLRNWSPYQTYQLPITNAPTNKMFLRVHAVVQ